MSIIQAGQSLPQPETAPSAAGLSVPVSFYTTSFHAHMPEQVYNIPITTLPAGLNELVNMVLRLNPPVTFDFLHNDEYIVTSLERFMRRRSLTGEQTLLLEYTPAIQAKEGSKMPHSDWVSSVRCPVAGQSGLTLTGSYDRCIRLWLDEECIAVGGGHSEVVKEIALHPDNAPRSASPAKSAKRRRHDGQLDNFQLASASKDGSVRAWKYDDVAQAFECLGELRAHVAAVDTVDISHGETSVLATGSWDCTVKIFDWKTVVDGSIAPDKKQPFAAFTEHARPVLCVRWSHSNPRLLYSTGLDGSIKIWDASKAQLNSSLDGDHSIYSLASKPLGGNADSIIVGCTDNRIRLYDTRERKPRTVLSGHRQWVYGVCWMWRDDDTGSGIAGGNAEYFASCSEDATVRVWDTRCTSAPLLTQDRLHTDGVLDVTYAGNSEVVSCGKDNKTKTFSLEKPN